MGGGGSKPALPVQEITAQELETKLQEEKVIGKDVTVDSVAVTAYPSALHDCSVVQIKYATKNPGPKKLIIMCPTVNSDKQKTCEAMGVGFFTELRITKEFLDKVQMRNLKVFLKQREPTSVWFEYPEGGVPNMDTTADIRQAVKAVIHLARFHSKYWGNAQTCGLPDVLQRRQLKREKVNTSLKKNIAIYMKKAQTMYTPPVQLSATGESVLKSLHKFYGLHSSEYKVGGEGQQEGVQSAPTTLIHGNFVINNMTFEPFRVLDYTCLREGVPEDDLAVFLATALERDKRLKYQAHLIRQYVLALKKWGVVGYDEERCFRSVQLNMIKPLINQVVSVQGHSQDCMGADAMHQLSVVNSRILQAVEDWDCLGAFTNLGNGVAPVVPQTILDTLKDKASAKETLDRRIEVGLS